MPSQSSKENMSIEEAEVTWLEAAAKWGDVPEALRKACGVKANGSPAPGGLTETGRVMASTLFGLQGVYSKVLGLLESVSEAGGTARVEAVDLGKLRRQASRGSAASTVDALGLAGPLRAAIRAAAQSLASSLNDGAADDAGSDAGGGSGVYAGAVDDVIAGLPGEPKRASRRGGLFNDLIIECDAGHRTVLPTLGPDPYVLIRYKKVTEDEAKVEVIAGGRGLGDGENDLIEADDLILFGTRGMLEVYEHGRTLGEPGPGSASGIVIDLARPDASAAGPSTETPYGVPDGDTPQETPAPAGPVSDDESQQERSNSESPESAGPPADDRG